MQFMVPVRFTPMANCQSSFVYVQGTGQSQTQSRLLVVVVVTLAVLSYHVSDLGISSPSSFTTGNVPSTVEATKFGNNGVRPCVDLLRVCNVYLCSGDLAFWKLF